ncbi:MAG: FtsW/RodA/SpoVE family cell cycle protein [Candidatus Dadabacteria bacterium]
MFSFFRVRNFERTFLVLVTIVLAVVFTRLFTIYQQRFQDVRQRLANGTMINLNTDNRADRLAGLLQRGFYFEDPRDIELIRSVVGRSSLASTEMDNIGELIKRQFEVNAEEAYSKGGESFKKRVKLSRNLMGFTDDDSVRYEQEKKRPPQLPSNTVIGMGKYSISGKIKDPGDKPVAGVLVRIQMVLPEDSLYGSVEEIDKVLTVNTPTIKKQFIVDSMKHQQFQSLTAYARTDAEGKFRFTGLPDQKGYELLPLKPAYQFGPSKGTENLDDNISFSFIQSPHTIKLFSTRDFNNLKKEKALIVRMPNEVNRWYLIIAFAFFASFFLLHFVLAIRFPRADQFILPVIMVLTGISIVTLLSLQDPLRDRFFGKSTLQYFLTGILILFFLLWFDMKKFTTDSGFFRMFVFKRTDSAARGWPWAVAAVGLLILTILFGTGPEGSGVKVNLFGFQPSEIVKFLIIIFLAAFFTSNEKFISEYGRWRKRWSFFWFALIAIGFAILMFLILGDLGPAMVVCFTFIVLFSFSRGDFAYAIGSVVLYIVAIWLLKNIFIATAVTAVALLLSMLFIRKQLSESAIMVLVIIAGFLLLDKVPYLDKLIPGPVQRLVDRKAIWQDPWNNEVFGGDQIANGIWAMSSGGIQGQGIGEGFAKTIPEAHTDMILPSSGEEFGWAGILSIFIVFLIYLHRSIIIGRHSGRPFLFYLCSGIGIGTFVQFLLIAGGSTGALPLSGVSLPFMSYGGSSLIMNMVAAGFLLSASLVEGSPVQMNYMAKQHDRNLVPALIAALIGVVLLGVTVSRYLFNNKKWVVQPALVADRSGARMFSYNPRIAILMNRLGAGNLYDRNRRLLATSKPEVISQQMDSLVKGGLNPLYLQSVEHKRLDRYYPFAEQMFFWTGDFNTGIFMGATNGYYAEYEHIAELRGFETPTTNFQVSATRFRENRFLPRQSTEMTVQKRDYSALAPLLLAGINSQKVEEFKKRNRDVQMTVDAKLQTSINQALQHLDTLKNSRISVVVMEDNTGDVLASASYPLPTITDPEKLTLTPAEQNKLPYWVTNQDLGFTHATQPGSTAKLVTAMSAFNKLGIAAATLRIQVYPQDLIRTKSEEPDEVGSISIERGIVKSNNPFFIRLANQQRLQEQMGDLYIETGMFLRGVGGYYYNGDLQDKEQQEKWKELWRKTEFRSVKFYNPNNIRPTRGKGVSGMAWGQGELIATPAAVARMAMGIANAGVLMPNRYVMKVSDSVIAPKDGFPIAKDPQYAQLLTKYMKEQSEAKYQHLHIYVAGKTGTPERIVKRERINDGWYVFFAPKQRGPGHIITCIRIERTKGSSVAVNLAGAQVIPILLQQGYIKGFTDVKTETPVTLQ